MPSILHLYIAKRFVLNLGLILLAVSLIIFLADYVEVLRRFSDDEGFSALLGLGVALMRVPHLIDIALPFAFLFSALLTLLALSRKLELVVARASGLSVWGFLKAPLAVAFLLGAAAVTILNPVATSLKAGSERIESDLSGDTREGSERWFRQTGPDGDAIVHSGSVGDDGLALIGVTAFVYNKSGKFQEKITARRADFSNGLWTLIDAEIVSASSAPRREPLYELRTDLTEEEVRRPFEDPETVAIWSLPAAIDAAARSGTNPDRFRLAFQAMLNRPLFFMAMVLIAASVSLRLTRYGGTWKLMLTGVGAGFLLYVLSEIVSDLGGNGIIDPLLAAWLPPVAALTFGATALLHQEDG
jgi:lipopolysaccharide export system permease protein